jgi:hypothetical protein
MRRVHDTEPSPPSNKPVKLSRKRKSGTTEGGVNKRAPSSVTQPPQVVYLSQKEQFTFRKKQVEEQLSLLNDVDPTDLTTKEKLRNVENTIKEMRHLVHAVPKPSRRTSQISG